MYIVFNTMYIIYIATCLSVDVYNLQPYSIFIYIYIFNVYVYIYIHTLQASLFQADAIPDLSPEVWGGNKGKIIDFQKCLINGREY